MSETEESVERTGSRIVSFQKMAGARFFNIFGEKREAMIYYEDGWWMEISTKIGTSFDDSDSQRVTVD